MSLKYPSQRVADGVFYAHWFCKVRRLQACRIVATSHATPCGSLSSLNPINRECLKTIGGPLDELEPAS